MAERSIKYLKRFRGVQNIGFGVPGIAAFWIVTILIFTPVAFREKHPQAIKGDKHKPATVIAVMASFSALCQNKPDYRQVKHKEQHAGAMLTAEDNQYVDRQGEEKVNKHGQAILQAPDPAFERKWIFEHHLVFKSESEIWTRPQKNPCC